MCVCIIPVYTDKGDNKEKIIQGKKKLKIYWAILFLKNKKKKKVKKQYNLLSVCHQAARKFLLSL